MQTFVLLTRLSPEAMKSPDALETIEREAVRMVRTECPEVQWVSNFAVLGPYDYLDIFRAPDQETAAKVATIIRVFGHAHTEIWGAVAWERYKDLVRELPSAAHVLATAEG